jgi:shikimate kinase
MSLKNQHIFLCGFMGCGKSTLGRHLAKRMNREFIDLDRIIETATGKNVVELFNEHGEKAFRILEIRHLFDVIKNKKPGVVALGGGTLTSETNTVMVKDAGLLVYIALTAEELFERLRKSNTKRPLINGLSKDAMRLYIFRTLEEREKEYKKAHLELHGVKLNDAILLEEIKSYYART